MIMQNLIEQIKIICQNLGYEFYFGAKREINSRLKGLPAAWMELPAIKQVEGRTMGSVTYSVSMYLMCLMDEKRQFSQTMELENNALALYSNLVLCESVREVSEVETEVDFMIFPPLGEASIHLEFEVIMDFNAKTSER